MSQNQQNQQFPQRPNQNNHNNNFQREASTRDEAIEMLKLCFSQEAETKRLQQLKIDELSQIFPDISKDVITEALKDNNWDVDLAIVPLLQNHENQERDKKKQEQTRDLLSQFYSHFSEEDVSKVLAYHNYNFEKTAAQLLETIKQQERLKRQKEEAKRIQYDHDQKIAILEKKFGTDVKRPEIEDHLKRNNWDVYVAGTKLLKIVEERKIETLRRLYKNATQEDIQAALEAANWQFVGAVDILTKARFEKKPKPSSAATQDQTQQKNYPVVYPTNLNKSILSSDKSQSALYPEQNFMERSFYLEKQIGEDLLTSQHSIDPEWVKIIKDDLRQKVKPNSSMMEDNQKPEEVIDPQNSLEMKSLCLVGFQLMMDPEQADIGDTLTVKLFAPPDYKPQNDWIALYHENELDPQKYISYIWVTSIEQYGSLKFTAPNEYGKYYCRYYKNKSYRNLAQSNIVTVQPIYSITLEKIVDRKIFVKVIKESGNDHPNGWIALYPSEISDFKQFVSFQWLSHAKEGILEFNAPKTGFWKLQLFPTKNYVPVATFEVNIEGNDKLELTFYGAETYVDYEIKSLDIKADKPWIGLYYTDEQNYRQYRRSKTLSDDKGRIVFKTPIHGGTYHVRLFAGNSITPFAYSNPITVPDAI